MEMATMQERLNNLEMAQETICFAIATYAEAIRDEQKKTAPDEKKIARFRGEMKKFDDDMHGLRLADDVGVQNAIEKYTLFLKKAENGVDNI